MRAPLATLLAVVVAAGSGGTVLSVPATAQAAPDAKKLYDQGYKAYRLGRYGEAVKKFEEAYAASDNSLLLFNIGLAYKNWYSVSKDIGHLRKARTVFQNYLLEAQRNPDMGGDPAEAEAEIKQVDEMLARAEEEEREKAAAAQRNKASQPGPQPDRPKGPSGPDPGKKLRLGGVISMGVGGALFITGAVLGTVFGLKGQEFSDELQNLYSNRDDNDCKQEPDTSTCEAILGDIDTTRENGRKANLLTAISFGVMGGVGVAGLVTGGVLFAVGNKRTREWRGRSARLRIAPSLGGVVIRGRF